MTDTRHPAVAALLAHFDYGHLPPHLQAVSRRFHDLAHVTAGLLPDDPELTVGLRKLLEAKDCMVRAANAAAKKKAAPAATEPEEKGEPEEGGGFHRGSSLADAGRAPRQTVREPDTIVFGFGRRENW